MSGETLAAFLEPFIEATPLLAAFVAAAVISSARRFVTETLEIKPKFFPVLLTLAGAFVAGLAQALGLDIGDFNPQTATLSRWQTVVAGAMTGLATTGLHQAQKQLRKDE